jgi:hypothetical protein
MGWAIGYDTNWHRDVGYGVPAYCDHPDCQKIIDRGLSYVCGGDVYGGEHGCGLYFCEHHLFSGDFGLTCERCTPANCKHCFRCDYDEQQCDGDCKLYHKCDECGQTREAVKNLQIVPFEPKPEHPRWLRWKLKDASWLAWRKKNPDIVRRYREQITRKATRSAATKIRKKRPTTK